MKLSVKYERSIGGMIRWSLWGPKVLTEMEAQLAKAEGHHPYVMLGTGHSADVKKAKAAANRFADKWAKARKLRRMP